MKKILILGGTQFIGRNLVERLQGMDSYDITLFNRQQTQSGLFPELKKLKGDRETNDINQIANERWDYVIDLSCYYPDMLRRVLKCINTNLKKYIFISTCSVYNNDNNHSILRNEQAKILHCTDMQRTNRKPETYGNRKAECERILHESGINHIVLRPALVYGKYDHSDRFYYWLYQIKFSETFLLPENGKRTFSITYVNDLVDVIIQALTTTTKHAIYNVISIPQASIGQIINETNKFLHKVTSTINAPAAFLKRNNISQWMDMPLWLDKDYYTYSNELLKADFEIELTTLKDSIKDTLVYYHSRYWPKPKYGMTDQIRLELIESIKAEKLKSTKNKTS